MSFTDTEKRKKFIIDTAFFALILGLSILFMRYALPALISFVIALVVAFMLRPAVNFFTRRCKMNRTVASLIIVLLFYGIIGAFIILLGVELFNAVIALIKQLPEFYKSTIEPQLWLFGDNIVELVSRFDEEITFSFTEALDKFGDAIYTAISNFSGSAIKAATSTAISVPKFLFGVVISIVSTVFLTMDWEVIKGFFSAQLSEKHRTLAHNIVEHLGIVIRKYIVSYAIIMVITFFEILIGLQIIKVKGAIFIAALIAVFDILPIVGSGTIIIPWAIISLCIGQSGRGIGLIILWSVIAAVRYAIEPYVVGNNVGLHPLVTLFAMIAGVFLYGGVGILALPVFVALCQNLNDSGIIHLYKKTDLSKSKKPGKLSMAVTKFIDCAVQKIKSLVCGLVKKVKSPKK